MKTENKISKAELSLKLDKARWFILSNSPFYGQLVMSLQDVLGNPHGKTACTDGKRIFWDCEFLAGMTDEEVRFVLLHETKHCADGHLWRFPVGTVDHKTANQACDYAINLTLSESEIARSGKIVMPKGGLLDASYKGQAEEEIYRALSQKPKQDKGGNQQPQAGSGQGDSQDGQGDDVCGDFTKPADETDGDEGKAIQKASQSAANGNSSGNQPSQDGKDGGKSGKDSLRDEWQAKVIQAAQAAKASGQGDIPADMQRLLDKVAAYQIDWKQELADFVKNSQSGRNDWTKSSRRHAWQSVIYPRRRADDCGLIIGVRDTSGSISDEMAAQFSSLLGMACAENNSELILIDCDCRIHDENRIEPGGEIPLKVNGGGGGTSFLPPFIRADEIADNGEKVSGIIYLTDLQGTEPESVNFPTLWLCTENKTAKTGKTVKIEL